MERRDICGRRKKVPYNAEQVAKQHRAIYSKKFIPFAPYVVQDGNLITGQNPFSARQTAQMIIENLLKQ